MAAVGVGSDGGPDRVVLVAGARNIEHVESAHRDAQVEALKAAAQQRIVQGQGELDLGLNLAEIGSGPLEINGSRAGHLWDSLCLAYEALGFHCAAGSDAVFRDLVLARIIEPTSKADSLRVLAETGIDTVTYRTVTRRLRGYAKAAFCAALSAACTGHAGLGPASLVLFDVSTLLCRRRHNRVYADLSVMPMFWVAALVGAWSPFERSA